MALDEEIQLAKDERSSVELVRKIFGEITESTLTDSQKLMIQYNEVAESITAYPYEKKLTEAVRSKKMSPSNVMVLREKVNAYLGFIENSDQRMTLEEAYTSLNTIKIQLER